MKSILDFLESPLVIWAKTVINETKLNYEDFTNGYYFYLILKQSDPKLQNLYLPNDGGGYDFNSRLLNLDFLLRSIKSFYSSALNQILLCKLPDIYQIVKYSECEETFKELEKMLILLIGCAINGDYKELFIDNIQQKIDTQIQMELVPYIELVTEDINFAISKNFKLTQQQQQQIHSPDSSISSTSSFIQSCQQLIHNNQNSLLSSNQPNDVFMTKLLSNIQRIIDERDLSMESIIELQQDKDFLLKQLNQNGINGLVLLNNNDTIDNSNIIDVNIGNNDNQHRNLINANETIIENNDLINDLNNKNNLNDNENRQIVDVNKTNLLQNSKQQKLSMELVECKVKMRQLRMEIEEKSEQIETLREEINTIKSEVFKLKNENIELNQRASLANIYSEEIESLREKAIKSDKYESEMNKIKEKLEEFNLIKLRLEEYKDENIILLETRTYMEKQIDEYQLRISHLLKNENELYKYKQDFNELSKERDIDKIRIRELIEKSTKQELEIKNLLNEHHNLNEEMQYYKNKSQTGSNSSTTMFKQQHLMSNNHDHHHYNQVVDANTSSTDLFGNSFELQQTNSLKAKILQLELEKKKCDYEISMLRENEQKCCNELNLKNLEIEKLNNEIRDLNLKIEKINLNSKLEHNENEKIKELSLQLIKLQFDEKQLRKIKFDEENEILEKMRINEENLCLKLEQIKFENENLIKIEKNLQQEILKLKEDYEKCYNENYNQKIKFMEIEQELKKEQKLNESLKDELMEYFKEKEQLENKIQSNEKEIFKLKQQLEAKALSLNESLVKIKILAEQCKDDQLIRKKLADYENEIDILKQNYKNLELENNRGEIYVKELEEEFNKIKKELYKCQEELNNEKKKAEKEEQNNYKEEYIKLNANLKEPVTVHLTSLTPRGNNNILNDKYEKLNKSYEELKNKNNVDEVKMKKLNEEIEQMAIELHKYRHENNEIKLENAKLLTDIASKKENLQLLQFKLIQIQEKCQNLETINEKLEDEKSQLFEQLHLLLQQNQELLTQALNSKDVYHEQTKTYMEQLNSLRRQKESLEQKIMEQYKTDPAQKKKKPGLMDIFSKKTQKFVQKVRPKSAQNIKNIDINSIGHSQQNSSDENSQSNTMDIDSIEIDNNVLDNSSNSHSSFSIYQRNFQSISKSPLQKQSQSPQFYDENKLNSLSKDLAASANALNEIGQSNNYQNMNYYSNQRSFNSNDELIDEYDNSIVSSSQQRQQQIPTDLEIMIVEKAKSDSYMKYLDLQQQQQLLLTPQRQAKLLKTNQQRSSANSSPVTSSTTTNSSSCIISPSNSTSKMQDFYKRTSSPQVNPPQKTLFNGNLNINTNNTPTAKRCLSRQSGYNNNSNNISPKQNDIDYYLPQQETPTKLKPISIYVQSSQNNSINTVKSPTPSPSPKANEIWLEYGCI